MSTPRWRARDAGLVLAVTLLVAAIGAALVYLGQPVVGGTLVLLSVWWLVGILAWTFGDGRPD